MSCQDICVVTDYDGSNEFYREATRRAAKVHHCCECAEAIAVGELHHYATGKSDGSFWTQRTCAACAEIRTTFCCDGWMFTMLWEDIREQLFSEWNDMLAIDCLARLTTDAAIAKMRAEYAEYREARA